MLTKAVFKRRVKQISTKVVGDDREEEVLDTKVSNRIIRMDQRSRSMPMGSLSRCNNQDASQYWALTARPTTSFRKSVQQSGREPVLGEDQPHRFGVGATTRT